MKRFLPALLAALMLSCAQAQTSYVGFHLSAVTSTTGVSPFGSLQVGVPVADNVEVRLSGLPLLLLNAIQLDALYTGKFSEALRGYAGGGVDGFQSSFPGGLASAVHATFGVESLLGSGIGLFAEAQPIFVLSDPDEALAAFFYDANPQTFFVTFNLGVNLHF